MKCIFWKFIEGWEDGHSTTVEKEADLPFLPYRGLEIHGLFYRDEAEFRDACDKEYDPGSITVDIVSYDVSRGAVRAHIINDYWPIPDNRAEKMSALEYQTWLVEEFGWKVGP